VQSYLDRLDFGLVACPDLMPDVDALLDAILVGIDELARLAGHDPDGAAARAARNGSQERVAQRR
jgi:hypothetical protein